MLFFILILYGKYITIAKCCQDAAVSSKRTPPGLSETVSVGLVVSEVLIVLVVSVVLVVCVVFSAFVVSGSVAVVVILLVVVTVVVNCLLSVTVYKSKKSDVDGVYSVGL